MILLQGRTIEDLRSTLRSAIRAPGGYRCRLRVEGLRRWDRIAIGARRDPDASDSLPFGNHELEVELGRVRRRVRLVVAPPHLPRRSRSRRWGIFAPVYALREARTWGCGDLTSFEHLGEWAATHGASVLASLPLLPTFLDRPFEPSPYRPVSRRFWNELFLDPVRTPEYRNSLSARRFVRSVAFRRRVRALERRAYVDYRAAARLKRAVLERMLRSFERSDSPRRAAFREFLRRSPEIREYARFRAALERTRRPSVRYHEFVQWLTDEQLRAVATHLRSRGVDLCLDLPFGVHPRGFDAVRDAPLYLHSATAGSPPDPGVPGGQAWGFAPWNPARLRAAGYRPWIETLAHHFRIAHWLRVDHALGLHRVFLIPEGHGPSDGTYLRSFARELYATLVAEASRNGAGVVGEDLGTVPPELRSSLRRHGLLRLFVAQLEWEGPGRRKEPPADSVASLNTHDHPPFAAYWRERHPGRAPGKPTPSGARPYAGEPRAFRRALLRLAGSRAELVLLNLEDLWGERRPQNLPGRSGPRMFSRRFRVDLETVYRRRVWGELLDSVHRRRGSSHGRFREVGPDRGRTGPTGPDGPAASARPGRPRPRTKRTGRAP